MSLDINEISVNNTAMNRLRTLMWENPDLPVVVATESDVVSDSHRWWYSSEVSCDVENVIEVDGRIISNTNELAEYIFEESDSDEVLAYEETDDFIDAKLKEYKPLWKKCIVIRSEV